MKNFNNDIINKVIKTINEGLIDENFTYIDFNKYNINGVKYKKLEIVKLREFIIFIMYENKDTKGCIFSDYHNFDIYHAYKNSDFFKAVFDYIYKIEEVKHNKEILSNTFKQSSKTKKNKI